MKNRLFVILIAISLMVSCARVDYGDTEFQPDYSRVSFSYDWAEAQEEKPAELVVVMNRILNTLHYAWKLDSEGNIINVNTLDDNEEIVEEEDVPDSSIGEIYNGEYFAMCFSWVPENFVITGLPEFIEDPAASMKDLKVSLPIIDEQDDEEEDVFPDFNPSFDFISNSGPFYSTLILNQRVYPDLENDVHFVLSPLTRSLIFRMKITLGEGVSISSIKGDISGLAKEAEIMSRNVSDSVTYRSQFEFILKEEQAGEYLYEGRVDALGLFPAPDPLYITGPGILNLSIRAQYGEAERLFHASVNLKNIIEQADIMTSVAEGPTIIYRLSDTNSEVLLDIMEKVKYFKINKDQVLMGNDGNGVKVWKQNEYDDDMDLEL